MEPKTNQTENRGQARRFALRGLSAKLLGLTVAFVMVAEVLLFVPSVANFRNGWLRDRLAIARVTAVALSHPAAANDLNLRRQLLNAAGAQAIAVRTEGKRQLHSVAEVPQRVDGQIDMRDMSAFRSIAESFETLTAAGNRTLLIIGDLAPQEGKLDLILREAPLRDAMLIYSRNILGLSLLISFITAALLYLTLRWLFVRPLQRLTRSMRAFSANPDDQSNILQPSGRRDELGDAETGLSEMQSQLNETLQHQRRLANLGMAVSKINHDLRNMLSSAQLFTDRLGHLTDPTVQRLAPKLVNALDRAIGYTRSVLAYGRAQEAPPNRRLIMLGHLVDDVADMLGLPGHEAIEWRNQVPGDLEVDADPDQMFRVLTNLVRNAVQALDLTGERAIVRRLTVSAERQGGVVHIWIADTGPGIPERAREHLFKAFQGSARKGGTGLGLAIAAELIHAHGGEIALSGGGPGAKFEITIPDRPIDLNAARAATSVSEQAS